MKLPINNIAPTYTKQTCKKGVTTYAKEQQLVNIHCRPWMMIWKDHPHRASITIYERFFPGIEILKFCVDNGAMRIGELHNPATIRGPSNATAAVNDIAAVLMGKKAMTERAWGFEHEKVPRLVYLSYDSYGGRQPVSYGRIVSSVKAVGKAGFRYDRHQWSYYGEDEDLSNAEGYLVSHASVRDQGLLRS